MHITYHDGQSKTKQQASKTSRNSEATKVDTVASEMVYNVWFRDTKRRQRDLKIGSSRGSNIVGFCKDSRCVNGRVHHAAVSCYVRSEDVTSHGGGINRR